MRGWTAWCVALLLIPAISGCMSTGGAPDPAPTDVGPAPTTFSETSVPPGAYKANGSASEVAAPGSLAALPDEVLAIKSPVDGVPLQVGIVRPDTPERVPVIAWITPYLHDLAAGPLASVVSTYGRPASFLIDNFVPHGYAVALVAIRGTGGSGGCVDFVGPTERADTDHIITWLGTQEWSSGAVGTIGLSYEGSVQLAATSTGNPHLKTIVPVSGPTDGRRLVIHNGTPSPGIAALLPVWWAGYGLGAFAERSEAHRAEAAACPGLVADAARLAAHWATGTGAEAWLDERVLGDPANWPYAGSVLYVQGLRDGAVFPDHAYPLINEMEARGVVVKQLLGQWHHEYPDSGAGDPGRNPTPRWDFAQILLAWYDRWLKGDGAADIGPHVQVADSSGAWRNEPRWPPADAVRAPWYLGADGTLVAAPDGGTRMDVLAADPARLVLPGDQLIGADVACPACVSFTMAPAARELRFSAARADVTVTPLGPGGFVVATLHVVDGDGTTYLGGGRIDLRFNDGDTPATVTPGEPMVARVQFHPMDAVVPAGAKLVLTLSQGGHGNTDVAALGYRSGTVAAMPLLVHTGGDASVLRLDVFERGRAGFFDPPAA